MRRRFNCEEPEALAEETYELTREEVDKGWAKGPFTEEELNARFGHERWTACRRFGVTQRSLTTQKEKTRQFDDLSEFFVNSCTTIRDKIPVDGVDVVANLVWVWAGKIWEGTKAPERGLYHHSRFRRNESRKVARGLRR